MKFKVFKDLLKSEKDYAIIDNYGNDDIINSHKTKIKIKHLLCGHEYCVSYHDFSNGKRCPKCNVYRQKTPTIEEIRQQLSDLTGSEYTLLTMDEIHSLKSPLIMKHERCGRTFETTYGRFFGKKEYHLGNRCPFCSHGHIRKTLDEYKKDVYDLVGDEYTVIGSEYKGNKVPIEMLHNRCGHVINMKPNLFLQGHRCSYCRNASLGENKIYDILKHKGSEFLQEYRIQECRDKRVLPFDFYVKRNDGSWFLIEYQGSQHFITPGKVPFATQTLQKHDKIKLDYCKKNNIDLLVISFKDYDNLEGIITNKLSSTTIPTVAMPHQE